MVDYHLILPILYSFDAQGCISYEWYVAILVHTAIDCDNSIVATILCKIIEDNLLALRSLHSKGG